MKTIWKFELHGPDQTILMPKGAQILAVQMQGPIPCIWAIVDPHEPTEQRRFVTVGTGHPLNEEGAAYLGTFQMRDGALVWHLFETRHTGDGG